MKLILLSGGSGKRLWPLSNDARSKQFLRVLENEQGELVSMVQRVWNQLDACGLSESSLIATGQSQVEIMRSQVGADVPLIIEPERRDTFPAIALAATYLYSIEGVSLDEVITILPVDPYVDNMFFDTVKSMEMALQESDADIALIGVEPTYPSSKYGYIIPSGETTETGLRKVSRFQEKPTEEYAEQLIAENALWNCGVFAFKLGYLISLLEEKGLPIQYEQFLKQYDRLPKISFDYEVVEQAKNIIALPYTGYWKDLGTWNTLTEEMSSVQIGRGIISEDCVNTHLVNETNVPVTILGMKDVVVAVSPDGILVSDKASSPRLKELVNFDQGPMYEERQWGWVVVLDDQKYEDGRCVLTKRIGLQEGKNLSYQSHTDREEVWTVVKGEGEFVLNGNMMRVRAGNVLHIPVKALHSIRAVKDLEVIVVQTGFNAQNDQIVELFHSWEEIEQNCMKI
ncbi:sugar phosphate nucleotidyltransferase [Paenibacillus sp. PK4536]|uniref:Mannose-1-phosphate guanylyltransferase n=1 Tax=Paenibacillus nuruki TaxID=1886670 RepID=A0A1E3KY62_9BACL|nr:MULTISPECIES: sugar phosphate nucleotidyltransferase [Paenibacillus]ODP26333.1 Mannose-1-phosphate guanylyltransferase [Paenibacillus nuruki]TKJ88305.1 cupin domain-containing protein [Paenibacillus sp. CFBP13512]WIM40792.1 sugar phosphate nucleotidyltransferase [Paenibacillus sp. PK4536]CAJ1316854.1 Mannose-1-phosphate guanylyltransferase [Paenibacillus nuruki]